jgi:predicted O-linked N-acetylglucosamine transferase (SPINDLY family)
MLQELQRAFSSDFNVAHSLAYMLRHSGELERALPHARKACELAPSHVEARLNLAAFLLDAGQFGAARDSFKRAISLQDKDARAWHGLARALVHCGTLRESLEASARAIAAAPESVGFRMWHATTLCEAGRAAESYGYFREVLAKAPSDALAALTFAQRSLYDEACPEAEAAELHGLAVRLVCAGAARLPDPPPRGDADAGPIRVAYFSGDLREHSVASFLEPLLEAHDRSKFRVYCYSTGPAAAHDAVTARLHSKCDAWRDLGPGADGMVPSDGRAAEIVRADGIDVLVELSGLTPGQRLSLVASRPARAHFSYLGYPISLPIPGLDARLGDGVADAEEKESGGVAVVRVPGGMWCYRAPEHAPEVRPRDPARPITFVSFNYLAKITDAAVEAWSRILRETPGSRLIIKGARVPAVFVREDLRQRFASRGIDAGRVDVPDRTPDAAGHLASYDGADIALDTYPYCGTTTTCEALLMGVPVVTLAGTTHRSRVGLSLLTSVGLAELAATSWDGYVAIARGLAGDAGRLAGLRAGLRERMLGSALCDAGRVARGLEAVYQKALGVS